MLLFVGLDRDALIQHQAAGSVDAAAQNDGVAGHHALHGRLDGGGMGEFGAGRIGLAVRRNEVHLSGLGNLIALVDRAVRPAGRLCVHATRQRRRSEKTDQAKRLHGMSFMRP